MQQMPPMQQPAMAGGQPRMAAPMAGGQGAPAPGPGQGQGPQGQGQQGPQGVQPMHPMMPVMPVVPPLGARERHYWTAL
jgi:hypothetical protein